MFVSIKKLPLGFKVLHLSNLVTGFWLPIKPYKFKKNRLSSILLSAYEYLYFSIILTQFCMFCYLILNQLEDNVDSAAQSATAVGGYFNALFRSVYLYIFKNHIISIIKDFEYFLNNKKIKNLQTCNLNDTSKRILFVFILIPSILFISVNIFNTVYCYFEYKSFIEISLNHHSLNTTLSNSGEKRVSKFFNGITLNLRQAKLVFFLNGFISTMTFLKIITTDALMISFFLLISEQLKMLKSNLFYAVHLNTTTSNEITFSDWLQFQNFLAR